MSSEVGTPLLEVKDLRKTYELRRMFSKPGLVKALDGVSFSLAKGKTLAVVGESGCGKSTLAKCLMLIEGITSGEAVFEGRPLAETPPQDWRKQVQMIFQDPYSSLNPRKKCLDIIAEPLVIQGDLSKEEIYTRAREMMAKVGLRPEFESRYPHMFSGGQRQRIGIARALMLRPKLLICDEPVSALDVSIQAQVLNLLMDLQDEFGLSYLFISHDLSVVRHVSDHILVMYLGQVMEYGARDLVFKDAQNPYTQALLSSHPHLNEVEAGGSGNPHAAIQGELPSPLNPPPGCPFQKRCPKVFERCLNERPALYNVKGRLSRCHLHDGVAGVTVAAAAPSSTAN
ncbi:MAG: dipeptide ABC transporter ATP-binding protein [Proteobacteria bacterium]|nr:MAG: dipeptide ABC transporter ATP-binding protein [Pseudomonadota bacterium]